jgi:peptidoglycan/LPS O-acetylase OafA/YrhL
MISLSVLFYVLVALFVLIGAMRGFGKEIVVCASSILALFTIEVVIPRIFGDTSGSKRFWINTIVIVFCPFAGYRPQPAPIRRKHTLSGGPSGICCRCLKGCINATP